MFPVKLDEYAVGNKLEEEPVFSWWVPYTLSKRSILDLKLNLSIVNGLTNME